MSDIEKRELGQENCERCAMALVEPVFRCASGHEICGPCFSEVMQAREEEQEDEGELSEEEFQDAKEDTDKTDDFEFVDMKNSSSRRDLNCPEFLRPHTVGGRSWRKLQVPDHSNDELKVVKLRPPEHKKSFIDMIAGRSGMNISYSSNKSDTEDQEEDQHSLTSEEHEVHEVLEEVFKKTSNSSLDSGKSSGGSMKFKPIVCPLDSCRKFVSVSGLITHFKFDHPNIPIEIIGCNETTSFFVSSSIIETESIINEKIFIIHADFQEDSAYFTLNIANQCFAETAMLFIWVSAIKLNGIHYLYKIQAKNSNNDCGKVVSYFGPITNHQDPSTVFHKGDCLVIPMTVFDSFKDYADGFNVNVTFSVANEGTSVDGEGDAKSST